MDYQITEKMLDSYEEHLIQGEYAKGSIEKYLRDIRAFLRWAGKQPLTKELTGRWKEKLVQRKYAPVTVNSMLSALNGILEFLELKEYQVKFIKIQRKTFREQERELSREDMKDCFWRLVKEEISAWSFCWKQFVLQVFGYRRCVM